MNSTLSAELHSLSKHKTSSLHHPMCVAVPHYVECHLSYRDAWKKCLVSSPHTNNRTLTLSTSTSIPTSSELQAKWEDWRLTRNPRSWRHQLSLVSQWSYLSTQGSQHSEGYWEGRVTDTQLALFLLLRQVNNNSFTYTLMTSHSHSKNKGHCYRVNKMHTLVIYCGCVVVFDWKFLCPWCSTKTNDMKKGSTLMCVRALCLVVMVSVDLNCLLWVNHCFLSFIFSFFRASVFEDSIGWPLPGPLQKIPHTRHLSVSYVNLTRLWLPLSSAWKKKLATRLH